MRDFKPLNASGAMSVIWFLLMSLWKERRILKNVSKQGSNYNIFSCSLLEEHTWFKNRSKLSYNRRKMMNYVMAEMGKFQEGSENINQTSQCTGDPVREPSKIPPLRLWCEWDSVLPAVFSECAPGLENTLPFKSWPAKKIKINADCATVTLYKEPNLPHLAGAHCDCHCHPDFLSISSTRCWAGTQPSFSHLTALPDSWYQLVSVASNLFTDSWSNTVFHVHFHWYFHWGTCCGSKETLNKTSLEW